jgi:hypothetical protein
MIDFLLGIPAGIILFACVCGGIGWYYYRHPQKWVKFLMNTGQKKKGKGKWERSTTVQAAPSQQELPK